jgi:hypothetical protein
MINYIICKLLKLLYNLFNYLHITIINYNKTKLNIINMYLLYCENNYTMSNWSDRFMKK